MAMQLFDDIFDDIPSRPSLRIAPLQDPFPGPSSTSARPSPLEPNAHVNIDRDANKLTGRRKALAEAKPLDAAEPNQWETLTPVKPTLGTEVQKAEQLAEHPKKKQKLYDHEQIADLRVQLPKPQTKAKEDKPRPFRPIAVLHELHEPPPSAALFPPITPNASQQEQDNFEARGQSIKVTEEDDATLVRRRKTKERSASPASAKRIYNRGRTKWTEEETEQLVKGVAIYGMGRWKNILEHPEFHFQNGRTSMDLKDRFRVCFPPDAPHKWVRPMPVCPESDDETPATSPAATKNSPLKNGRLPVRARKHHWTEEEDAELDKGFRKYGYQWNLMVKDPDLHFDRRSGGQIRDRFRLRFPELYNQQDASTQPKKPLDKKSSSSKKTTATTTQAPPTRNKSHDFLNELITKPDDNDGGGDVEILPDGRKTPPSKSSSSTTTTATTSQPQPPSYITTGLNLNLNNVDDEDNRLSLSNSILHDDWDWNENLTLAPVAWEDMANKPMFSFD